MQLVFSSVERALGDSQSILSRAVNTALKIGMKVPARLVTQGSGGGGDLSAALLAELAEPHDEHGKPALDEDGDGDESDEVREGAAHA